jgi:hypothetical protein
MREEESIAMRLIRRLLVVYTLSAILLACAAGALLHMPAQGSDIAPRVGNAAWIEHQWVGLPPSAAAVGALCTLLRAHGIGTVFVHVGPADASGRIAAGRAPYAGQFVAMFHELCPGVRALAWIGQLLPSWDGLVDLRSAATRTGLVATAAGFSHLGFDGIQYDLEPVRDGDRALLDLLRQARQTLDGKRLAVATPALRPLTGLPSLPHLHMPLSPWSPAYYAAVAALVDEVDPMLYVTSLRTSADYSQFVAEQVRDLTSTLSGARIRVGLPAFSGRTEVFDARVENLSSGCAGLDRALTPGRWPMAFAGVALYPLWEMTPASWAIFDRWRSGTTAP